MTKKAVWQTQGYAREALQDGGAASQARLMMFLEYVDQLKTTKPSVKYRILYNGVTYNLQRPTFLGTR